MSLDPDVEAAFTSASSGDPDVDASFPDHQDFAHDVVGAVNSVPTAIGGFPKAVAKAGVDLYRRATGGDPNAPSWADRIPAPTPTPEEQVLQKEVGGRLSAAEQQAEGSPVIRSMVKPPSEGTRAVAGDLATIASAAAPFIRNPLRPLEAAGPDAQAALDAAASSQSMGAAGASLKLNQLSPDLQTAVQNAVKKTGGAVNQDALIRHAEADSMGVQLTAGQALQDHALISKEQNLRGARKELADRFNQQNGQLVSKLQDIRDQVGPEVFSTNPIEHGDTLIKSYKDMDAPVRADISAKYDAANAASASGNLQMDGSSFVDSANAALKAQSKFRFLPSSVQGILDDVKAANGAMSLHDFQAYDTQLGNEIAKAQRAGDGNAVFAIKQVKNALNDAEPVGEESAQAKQLYDTARASAKARFDRIDADPAYDAAINATVAPDQFVRKFVTGGNRDDIATMKGNLKGDDTALQTMEVAGLDHLRGQAGIDQMGNGTLSQARYNRTLQDLRNRGLFSPGTSEQTQTLGNVARYTQFQPRGSFVNNSNSAVSLLADHAASGLEGMANVAAKGIPVGTIARRALQKRAAAAEVNESLKPGAGLTKLSDLARP